jgi:hypothetical protein
MGQKATAAGCGSAASKTRVVIDLYTVKSSHCLQFPSAYPVLVEPLDIRITIMPRARMNGHF